MAIETLKRRADFVRLRGGVRWQSMCFAMQASGPVAAHGNPGPGPQQDTGEPKRPPATDRPPAPARIGLTVTKALGNAVVRNRIRRRLRAAVRQIAPDYVMPGSDYVLIARQAALKRDFVELLGELSLAFERVNGRLQDGKATRPKQQRAGAGRHGASAPGHKPPDRQGGTNMKASGQGHSQTIKRK